MNDHLEIRPLGFGYFLCWVKPIALAEGVIRGVKLVPMGSGLRPVTRLMSGALRSDGERMMFWGGDSRLPVVTEVEGHWHREDRLPVITRVQNPRIVVISANGASDSRNEFAPSEVHYHRDDLAPWYLGGFQSRFTIADANRVPHLLKLADEGKLQVGQILWFSAATYHFAPTEVGLMPDEWRILGFHSLCATNPTRDMAIGIAAALDKNATNVALPPTLETMEAQGFGLPTFNCPIKGTAWQRYVFHNGKVHGSLIRVNDPAKAALWLNVPEIIHLPAGATLDLAAHYYWGISVPLGEMGKISFQADETLNFKASLAAKTVNFEAKVARLSEPVSAAVAAAPGCLIEPAHEKDFIACEVVTRKYFIPGHTKRLKLHVLRDGSFQVIKGTFLRRGSENGFQRIQKVRSEREEAQRLLKAQIVAAVGRIPESFDFARHTVADAMAFAAIERAQTSGELVSVDKAAAGLAAILPIPSSSAVEMIGKLIPGRLTCPVRKKAFVPGPFTPADFVEEHAGSILMAIDRRWLGFVTRILNSEKAVASVSIAVLGG